MAAARSSLVGKAIDSATGLRAAVDGGLNAIRPFFMMLVVPMFLLGAALSIYLPLVPFITWFGAIVNWLVVVLEGVIAAPLWALAHLDGQGEGMGERSAHGYLFLLNLLARPFLMVLGFIGGGACMEVGGTYLNQVFGYAVAIVQFNSVTGIVSLLGFLYLYFTMCVNMVHSCFNLIFIVPDQVINWVGGAVATRIGRDDNETARGSVNVLLTKLGQLQRSPQLPALGPASANGNGVKR